MPLNPQPEEVLWFATWLMIRDKEFLQAHNKASWRAFPKGALQYLVSLSQRLKQPLSRVLVISTTESDAAALRRHGAEAKLVRRVFDDLNEAYSVDEESLPAMRQLCAKWLKSRALRVGGEAMLIAIEQGDIDKAIDLIEEAAYDVETREAPLTTPGKDEHLHLQTYLQADACPTGIYEIDKAWSGGTRAGELGIIMGGTGLGKSFMTSWFAANAFWSGRHALYYTTELTKEQIHERIVLGLLQQGRDQIDFTKTWGQLLAKAAMLQQKDILPDAGFTVKDGHVSIVGLRHDFEDFRKEHGSYPGMVVLDSPDDMQAPGKFDRGYEGLEAAYVMLRSYALDLGFPIWTTAQVNREAVEKSRVTLKNIGSAFAKAQKSHYVLGLAPASDGDDVEKLTSIFVLKDSLHGSTGGQLLTAPTFGRGQNGYPGMEIRKAQGFNLGI